MKRVEQLMKTRFAVRCARFAAIFCIVLAMTVMVCRVPSFTTHAEGEGESSSESSSETDPPTAAPTAAPTTTTTYTYDDTDTTTAAPATTTTAKKTTTTTTTTTAALIVATPAESVTTTTTVPIVKPVTEVKPRRSSNWFAILMVLLVVAVLSVLSIFLVATGRMKSILTSVKKVFIKIPKE